MLARRCMYLVATGMLAMLGFVVAAPAASAHATLVSASPADGAVVTHAPPRVSATFDEAVGVSTDSLEVFAPNGDRVDTGGAKHGSAPQDVTVALLPGLSPGTYTVGWHVVSDDSHPVQGAFTFSVGAPSTTAVSPATLSGQTGALVGVVFGVVRWIAFCSFALLIGAVGFVIWCWPSGAARPAVLRLTMGAWAGLAFSVLAAVLLQGVYGAGQGIGHLFWPDVLHATLHSRYGRALGVRLLLVVAALFMFTITLGAVRADRRPARTTAAAAWAILTAALAATWAVADHAGTGSQVMLAVPADTIHLSAMAIWLGGLVMLATIVLRRPGSPGPGQGKGTARRRGQAATAEAAQAVVRFSPIALGCVVAIVVTGTYQSWRNVGTLGALAGTGYGRLLLVKIAAMCALIGLGYLARRRIADGLRTAVPVRVAVAEAATTERVTVNVGAGARPSPAKAAKAAATAGGVAAGAGSRQRGRNGQATAGPRQGKRGPGQGRGSAAGGAGGSLGVAPRGERGAVDGAPPGSGRTAVSLARLRWSVTIEVLIAFSVLAVTAVLVNTPTGRDSFAPPASAAAVFDTGGPGGQGRVLVTVTPARLGPNQVRLSVTTTAGRPYRPQQIDAAMSLPARHLGPLPVPLIPGGPGRYRGGPVVVTMTGQWQLHITVRSDATDEATTAVPISIR